MKYIVKKTAMVVLENYEISAMEAICRLALINAINAPKTVLDLAQGLLDAIVEKAND